MLFWAFSAAWTSGGSVAHKVWWNLPTELWRTGVRLGLHDFICAKRFRVLCDFFHLSLPICKMQHVCFDFPHDFSGFGGNAEGQPRLRIVVGRACRLAPQETVSILRGWFIVCISLRIVT